MEKTFMNLMTDYAFKRVFGTERNKGIVIRFLNALFAGQFEVSDVRFHDKEILPEISNGKKIIYDVYCTHKYGKGEHFILEMQKAYEPVWESRTLTYTARAIVDQTRRGEAYDINPVYSIYIMDFRLKDMSRKIRHSIRLMDRDTHELYTDKVGLEMLSLEELPENWSECVTELSRLLYLIKNMHNMDKNSKPYESGQYEEIFDASDISTLAKEEYVTYSESELKLEENQRALEYAKREAIQEGLAEGRSMGLAEGLAEGRAEGRVEGRVESLMETAVKLAKAGMTREFIIQITGLDDARISQALGD